MKILFNLRIVFIVFCFLTLLGNIWPGDASSDTSGFNTGYKAYLKKNFKKAIFYWRPLANKGNSNAQYHLGIMFFNGQGVNLDFAKAAKWFQLSAAQGDVGAQYMIGEMTLKGIGTLKDYKKAGVWFQKSAKQGYPDAQLRLGEWYADETEGNIDLIQAYVWLSLAEANGLQASKQTIQKIKKKLSNDEIEIANRSAKYWWLQFQKN